MASSVSLLFIRWYLLDAPRAILIAWRNFLIWAANTFSLGLTVSTLFAPWRRTVMVYRAKGLDINYWIDSLIYTNFSRVIGFVVRIFTIIAGLIWLATVFIFGLILFIGWFLLPLIVLFLLISAFA